MRKIYVLFFSLVIVAMSSNAQDVITLKNGDDVQAKVTEITPSEIKYKRFDNQEGPTITIKKSDVFMIKYQNGTKDVFNSETTTSDDESFWNQNLWTNQRIAGLAPFIDLGGFAFTGPRLGLEGRYRRFAVNVFYKYGNVGALNTAYLDDNEMANPAEDIRGNGAGFTLKVFLPLKNTNSAFHFGVLNEWSNYSCKFIDGTREIDWTSTAVGSSGLGCGYSYHSKSGFYGTLGGYWGLSAFNLEFTRPTASDPETIYTDAWLTFFGICEITLGYEFPIKGLK